MRLAVSGVLLAVSLAFCAAGMWRNMNARAMHADESEQATTFLKLYTEGVYNYNPNGPHGPTLYYWADFAENDSAKTPAEKIGVLRLRALMLPMAAAALLAFFALAGEIGLGACMLSAAAFAGTSLMQIYGTYFIQEIIFSTSVFLTTAFALKFALKNSAANALALGVCAGFALACKETAVISFAAAAAAAALLCCISGEARKNIFSKKSALLLCFAAAAFAATAAAWYSSFGANPQGAADVVKSYSAHFFGKAAMAEHSAPASFYIKLLFAQKSGGAYFGEAFVSILSLAGIIAAIVRRREKSAQAALFFAAAGIASLAILSCIPYKMPWLALSPAALLCVPAGYAAHRALSQKPALAAAALCAMALLFAFVCRPLARNAVERFHSDPRNPFIYSHTVSDENNLAERILRCAEFSEYKKQMPVAVITKVSPWPLPFQLRGLSNAGFYSAAPQNIGDFEVVVCDAFTLAETSKKLDLKKYVSDMFGLRKNIILTVFIKREIFEKLTGE